MLILKNVERCGWRSAGRSCRRRPCARHEHVGAGLGVERARMPVRYRVAAGDHGLLARERKKSIENSLISIETGSVGLVTASMRPGSSVVMALSAGERASSIACEILRRARYHPFRQHCFYVGRCSLLPMRQKIFTQGKAMRSSWRPGGPSAPWTAVVWRRGCHAAHGRTRYRKRCSDCGPTESPRGGCPTSAGPRRPRPRPCWARCSRTWATSR